MQYFLVSTKLNPMEKYYKISKMYMNILNDELQRLYYTSDPQNMIPPMINQPNWKKELKIMMQTENTRRQSLV